MSNPRCPTFTFKNRETGKKVTINQSDYNDKRYAYLTGLDMSNWTRVSESNAGGDVGHAKSKLNGDMAINILNKRKIEPLNQKVKF
jgi:hypothetical protein